MRSPTFNSPVIGVGVDGASRSLSDENLSRACWAGDASAPPRAAGADAGAVAGTYLFSDDVGTFIHADDAGAHAFS